jgi:hypothetical protein
VKTALLILMSVATLALPVSAISPKRIEGVKKRAAEADKLIAFAVMADYYLPNCPKCVKSVDAKNGKLNRMIPHKGVIVIKLDKKEVKEGDVPAIVLKGPVPRIVITDAACTKVIDSITDTADKERVKEMEAKIAAALSAKA